MTAHRRRYRLRPGLTVEFIFRLDECREGVFSDTALICEWAPAVPKFPPGNALNKFLRLYCAARDDFLSDVAQMVGGSVAILNIDHEFKPGKMSVFNPVVPS